jgi:hypothetical protein
MPMTSYSLLHWVNDKWARSGSDGHLDFGTMVQISSSNGPPTSQRQLLRYVTDKWARLLLQQLEDVIFLLLLWILKSEVSRVIF